LNFALSIIGRNGMHLSISVDVVQSEQKAWYKKLALWGTCPPKMCGKSRH